MNNGCFDIRTGVFGDSYLAWLSEYEGQRWISISFGVHSAWKTYQSTTREFISEQTSIRKMSQETVASKAAISERSGYRIEKGEHYSIPRIRHWRTRENPSEAIWDIELIPLLAKQPQLTGLTLWEYLEYDHTRQFPCQIVLRTLRRRVKHWKAT